MTAVIISLAEAIVTELNSDPVTNFGLSFKAERSYADWKDELKDLDVLKVDVIPITYPQFELGTHDAIDHQATCQIVMRKRLIPATDRNSDTGRVINAVVDKYVEAMQKVAAYFVKLELSDYIAATWVKCGFPMCYDRQHLRDNSQYTGIVEVTYEVLE